MKRGSIYDRYQPGTKPPKKTGKNYWFIFNSDNLFLDGQNNIPLMENLNELLLDPVRIIYLGMLKGHQAYVAEIKNPNKGFHKLNSLYGVLDEDIFLLAGRAIQIIHWDKDHQFCGRCGTPTINKEGEIAKLCPNCGFFSYPRISPAVIVAITHNTSLLMAKHSYGLKDRYSLIAGFIEPGETLEEGLKREIMEEVGLEVRNVQYFGSQPWPFPHSLMVGFTAEYKTGQIKVDGKEILEARWFKPEEVSPPPSNISIASELIDWFIKEHSK